ncbi:MAG TPA: protein kinase [Thermoanaerobaculia bacterium]|nr:protein kinase [Thermoanaerobaculia bacterium]
MSLSSGQRIGSYEILSPLGVGGMGEVYRARDTKLDRDVALKVLPAHLADDPAVLERFEREAKAIAALSHPNILSIFDFGISDGVVYAVTELLEGETLRARLSAGALPARKAVEYGVAMAQGLAAAHEKGIVHRDLKPENVIVTRDGRVKLLDFGLALVLPSAVAVGSGSGARSAGLTEPGTVLGTAGYMSPEQVRGGSADHRSDIFSFGAVFYEMLTGRRAFHGDSAVETMMAILQSEPPGLSEASRTLPPELVEIVAHCLEKSPEERFQSARDLAFALRFGEREERSSAPRSAVAEEKSPSIAVLPFRNMSSDREAEYFSDGMTEEILNALAQIPTLRVAARTSSFAFKGRDTDVRQIGRELGVRTVLEGSVRQSGQRLRVTAQLIDVGSGYHLWSDRFDREMRDVFAVQDEIARAIVETLKVRLLEGAEAPLVGPATKDVEAYNLYLKGRYYFGKRQIRQAIEQFEAAVARDASFGAAYLGLADSYAVWGFYGGIPTWEAFARARAAAERASEVAPGTAGVHLSLGIIEHYYGWDMAREERELRLAIDESPRSFEGYFWLTLCLCATDRFEEVLSIARRGVEVEPHSANAQTALGWAYAGPRQFEKALPEFSKAVSLDPEAAFPLWSLGYAQHQTGALEEAIGTLGRGVAITKREYFFQLSLLGSVLVAAGRQGEARAILSELREKATRVYVPPFDLAVLLISLGEREEALRMLERAYEERNALFWFRLHLPMFDVLREEPRWRAIAEKLARTAPLKRGGGW